MKTFVSILLFLASSSAAAEWNLKTVLDTKRHRVAMEVDIKIDNEILPSFNHRLLCSYGDGRIIYLSIDRESQNKTPDRKQVKIPAQRQMDEAIKELSNTAKQMSGFPKLIHEDGRVDLEDLKDIAKIAVMDELQKQIESLQAELKNICDKNADKN